MKKYDVTKSIKAPVTVLGKSMYYRKVTPQNGKQFKKKDVEKIVNKMRKQIAEKIPDANISVVMYLDGTNQRETKGYRSVNEVYSAEGNLYVEEDIDDYGVNFFYVQII